MPKKITILRNENGSIIAVGLLILALLTVIGASATRTSTTELKITTNAQRYQMNFYVAESGWKEGALWIEGLAGAPRPINNTGNVVRNFGGGAADVLNDTFPDGTQDRTIEATPYWYRATYLNNQRVEGNSRNFRQFNYTISSNANRAQQIDVGISKIYRVGY